jgi:hypothetical protein
VDLDGSDLDGKVNKEGVESNCAPSRRNIAAPYSPRKAELEWNVRSVLGQLPDVLFGKWDISWFVSQLQAVRSGDLDPAKVRQGMEAHGLDKFDIDVLFTVAGIELPGTDGTQFPIPETAAALVGATQ